MDEDDGAYTFGALICRWTGGADQEEGIYWTGSEYSTLFEAMAKYLTMGQTMEIISYVTRYDHTETSLLVRNERAAHNLS